MTTVSGIATASGVSALLTSPRDANVQLRATAGDAAHQAALRRQENVGRSAGSVLSARPVSRPEAGGAALAKQFAPSTDARYQKFLKALEVLRQDNPSTDIDPVAVAKVSGRAASSDGLPQQIKPTELAEAKAAAAAKPQPVSQARQSEVLAAPPDPPPPPVALDGVAKMQMPPPKPAAAAKGPPSLEKALAVPDRPAPKVPDPAPVVEPIPGPKYPPPNNNVPSAVHAPPPPVAQPARKIAPTPASAVA